MKNNLLQKATYFVYLRHCIANENIFSNKRTSRDSIWN